MMTRFACYELAYGKATSDTERQALKRLASECITVAEELSRRLGKLRVDLGQKSKWRTARSALKNVWGEEKINATYKRLEHIRGELALRLTMITKDNVDLMAVSQDERFTRLDQQTSIIIQRLVKNPSELISTLASQTARINSRQDESDKLAVKLQQETLMAINRLGVSSNGPFSVSSRTPSPMRNKPRIQKLNSDEVSTLLLEKLKFRQMFERQDNVSVAHPETFRWILEDDKHHARPLPLSPLLPWLQKGEGCYWVSGKAGSGKSTLMKFLGSSDKVEKALLTWAGSNQLIMASFYFWRGGTNLQKSQEGLLRWLLLTILSQRRDLVSVCFPQTFTDIKDGEEDISEVTPSLEWTQKAFKILSEASLKAVKIFLFIDGVDEFDGDHADISQFFRDLAASSVFKIILSSRPISACAEAFKSSSSLLLQDLTKEDIKRYVEDIIVRHERMGLLRAENQEETSKLTQMILSKASGVFLWVKLVVKSLLDGFRNYDRISDLQHRVDEYPSELETLYLHMLQSMEERYQRHASQLLQNCGSKRTGPEKSATQCAAAVFRG